MFAVNDFSSQSSTTPSSAPPISIKYLPSACYQIMYIYVSTYIFVQLCLVSSYAFGNMTDSTFHIWHEFAVFCINILSTNYLYFEYMYWISKSWQDPVIIATNIDTGLIRLIKTSKGWRLGKYQMWSPSCQNYILIFYNFWQFIK